MSTLDEGVCVLTTRTGLRTRKSFKMRYKIYRDATHQWRWRLVAANYRIIANSGEGYWNEADCIHAINLVAGSDGSPIDRE